MAVWDDIANGLTALGSAVIDFALPPRCPACGDIVDVQHGFCAACWASIRFLGDPCCAMCGSPFAYDLGSGARCGSCLAEPPPFDRARAVMAYGPVAREVVLRFKYGRRTGLARLIARHMVRHMPLEAVDILLVPVPLHRWRLWKRGFNQSALVATALGRLTGAAVDNESLVRRIRTPPMKRMGPARRRRLVKGAFALISRGRSTVAGRHIVLIDDIHTSGATIAECARVLRRAGAARIDCLCWARVLDDAEARD